jgi:hypothetical protein
MQSYLVYRVLQKSEIGKPKKSEMMRELEIFVKI